MYTHEKRGATGVSKVEEDESATNLLAK